MIYDRYPFFIFLVNIKNIKISHELFVNQYICKILVHLLRICFSSNTHSSIVLCTPYKLSRSETFMTQIASITLSPVQNIFTTLQWIKLQYFLAPRCKCYRLNWKTSGPSAAGPTYFVHREIKRLPKMPTDMSILPFDTLITNGFVTFFEYNLFYCRVLLIRF